MAIKMIVEDAPVETRKGRDPRPNVFASLLKDAGIDFPLPEGKHVKFALPIKTDEDKAYADVVKRDISRHCKTLNENEKDETKHISPRIRVTDNDETGERMFSVGNGPKINRPRQKVNQALSDALDAETAKREEAEKAAEKVAAAPTPAKPVAAKK